VIDCTACIGVIAALIWWRSPRARAEGLRCPLPAASLSSGLRHIANNQLLRATLTRAAAFFLFASASSALLPLVARSQMAQGPACYGVLLGAGGIGAFGGSIGLGLVKHKVGGDGGVVFGTPGTAFALVLFGLARAPVVAVCASVIAGASSSAIMGNLHASAQTALPDRVRAGGTGDILDGHLRVHDDRKCGMGAHSWYRRLANRAFRCRRRRGLAHPVDAALEPRAWGACDNSTSRRDRSSPGKGAVMCMSSLSASRRNGRASRLPPFDGRLTLRVPIRSPARPTGWLSKQPS
jgi:Transmembrane secretion effector